MLFIATLVNFSLSTSAPQGIVLLISTSGKMDVILGCALIYDLILCRKFKIWKIIWICTYASVRGLDLT
jgi:hypothetical protein